MKRSFLSFLFLCFFFSSPMEALPLGNPWDASLLDGNVFFCRQLDCGRLFPVAFRAGLYEDYVKDRHLGVSKGANKVLGRQIHKTTIRTDAAYLALNVCNLVDVFGTLGNTRIDIAASQLVWDPVIPHGQEMTYLWADPSFSWSIGARASLLEYGCFKIGLEGQYFSTNPSLPTFRAEGIIEEHLEDVNFKYQEWQIGAGITYLLQVVSINSLVAPYVGVKWAYASGTTHDAVTPIGFDVFYDVLNPRVVGYACGLTFVWSRCASITVEARFVDEAAYSLNAQIAF